MRYLVRGCAVLLAGVLVACGGDSPTEPDDGGDTVTGEPSVSISPSEDTLTAIEAERSFQVEIERADGSSAPDSEAGWSSSDTAVASVDGEGRAVARAAGTSRIVATFEEAADTATLVVAPEVDQLLVSPEADTVDALGGEAQLEADPRDANDHTVQDATPAWSSSDTTVATVDSTGLVTGQMPGEADIAGEIDGAVDTARITVLDPEGDQAPSAQIEEPGDGTDFAPDDTITFRGSAIDLEDGDLTGADLVWSSNLDGTFGTGEEVQTSGLSSGDHEVVLTATDSQGQTGTDTIAVTVREIANLTLDRLQVHRRGLLTSETGEAGGVVVNTGGSESGSFQWDLTLNGTLVTRGSVDNLASGDSIQLPLQDLPTLAEGGHTLALEIDPFDEVAETDETDNALQTRMSAYPSGFGIELDFLTEVDSTKQAAFEDAADRWAEVVTADLPDVVFNSPVDFSGCAEGAGERSETVDDLLIFVRVDSIDGEGGTLGQAGPCDVRTDPATGQILTAWVGSMTFDEADLDRMADEGTLSDVILHEMGHVLGVGTLWELQGLSADTDTDEDPIYIGPAGRRGFSEVGGDDYSGRPVPIANTGGSGTRFVHWRESVFENELMSGFISDTPNPMSVVTVRSLGDQFYAVDPAAADAYTLPLAGGVRVRSGRRIDLGDDVLDRPLLHLHRDGRVRLRHGPSRNPAGQR